MNYVSYFIDKDFVKHRKHIWFLLGAVENGCAYVVASYSVKTKRLLIKCANEHIPTTKILQDFVSMCEKKGESND